MFHDMVTRRHTASSLYLATTINKAARQRDAKREAVLRTAVQLFLEQGYHRATLNEVAERLNITKPAIYNYFRGKDDIRFECWVMGQEAVFGCIGSIDAAGGTGLAKLRELVRGYARLMATDYGRSLVRFDIRDLSEQHAAVVRSATGLSGTAWVDVVHGHWSIENRNQCLDVIEASPPGRRGQCKGFVGWLRAVGACSR